MYNIIQIGYYSTAGNSVIDPPSLRKPGWQSQNQLSQPGFYRARAIQRHNQSQ
jgi:hypothetical protein